MIEINIKKRVRIYNGTNLIQVKASFHHRHITQIIGPSGSGKTTLLKIIAGLIKPEEGKITVNENVWLDTKANRNLEPQKRSIGFVFQDYALFPNMTVIEHLQYGSNDAQYIDRLIAIGRLDAFRTHKPKHLSGGQQQRLAILRALSTKPSLLLMDEPFSALDNVLKKDVMTDLKTLFDELKITCLVVTHHPLETEGFAEYSFLV
ncbi:ATP-binding cassette domain-containing protein [Pedobacter panaciterrae]|uniref:ATP-binding cassette domain-containing protein n=1 Tax=Pedobacter panaciterrae TaxID=363849 RepID=UPI00155DAA7C|nr:ATP-binding cassette domain-containing protein [Pedobacter panaciterrae]NQX53330.1 ATP-binding cassette domain-containing protein [Pedobacter panaciterrae]